MARHKDIVKDKNLTLIFPMEHIQDRYCIWDSNLLLRLISYDICISCRLNEISRKETEIRHFTASHLIKHKIEERALKLMQFRL